MVCLKQVNKRALEDEGVVRQFQREVETHVRLDHAHILKMFAYFHDACYCESQCMAFASRRVAVAMAPRLQLANQLIFASVRCRLHRT